MRRASLLVLLFTCYGALCTSTEPTTTTTVKNVDEEHESDSSGEVSVPANMNIADYYYSIFGKHLDYDYREPIVTFNEPNQNELSDEILSEVDRVEPWEVKSRKKRFILVPTSFYNTTRQWVQQVRRMRQQRRRLRMERRQQWQQNRIRYLNHRADALQRQAARLSQLQQRQLPETHQTQTPKPIRQVPLPAESTHRIMLRITSTTAKPTSSNPVSG